MGIMGFLKRAFGSDGHHSEPLTHDPHDDGYITAVYQDDGVAVIVHDSLSDPATGLYGELRYQDASPAEIAPDTSDWDCAPILAASTKASEDWGDFDIGFSAHNGSDWRSLHSTDPMGDPLSMNHSLLTGFQGINPSTGLPMTESGLDIAGNAYGTGSSYDSGSVFDDSFGGDLVSSMGFDSGMGTSLGFDNDFGSSMDFDSDTGFCSSTGMGSDW